MWEYDAQHDSIITAGNGGTKTTQAAFTIFYNQGTEKYELEQTLQPDEQMWIDVGKLIREQTADKNGKTLPANLTSGSYEFHDLTDHAIGSLFEGKVIYDKTYGHVTYGCALCCALNNPFFSYTPLNVPLGSTAENWVNAVRSCDGAWLNVTSSFDGGWTTANTNIATVDSVGVHTGISPGTTTTTAIGYLTGSRPPPACPARQQTATGSDTVTPQLRLTLGNQYNSIFVGSDSHLATPNSVFATVSPTGGTFTETSSASGDTFTPVSQNGPGWVVTTATQSASTGDRKLTIKYTVNGQTNTQSLNVTARQFAYVTNNSLGNICTLGYGTKQVYTYSPYTHPDKTAVQAGIGLSSTAVTENFNTQPPAGSVTGSGALDANSQFADTIAYCSTSPLPGWPTVTQTLSIAGYQVRQNTLAYSSSGVTYTSLGPTQ